MEPSTVYVHYGDDTFHQPNPITNRRCFTKPHGGLWASRKDDPHGWKNWCEDEEFRLDMFGCGFYFALKPGAKVLELSHEDQLKDLPKLNMFALHPCINYSFDDSCNLDFEALKKEYDAIELTNIGRLYFPLYGWDCNSILVMNPEVVEVLGSFNERRKS